MKKRIRKLSCVVICIVILTLSFNVNTFAENKKTDTNNSINFHEKVKKLIPKKQREKIDSNEKEKEKIETSVSYGLLETLATMQGDPDCPWEKEVKHRNFSIQKIVPIYDLNDELSQTMIIFNNGFMLVDSDSGEVVQYSYGEIDLEYFEQNDKIYTCGLEYFAVSHDQAIDGTQKGKNIKEIKNKFCETKTKTTKRKNGKWGNLTDDNKNLIISSFSTGANEGNMYGDYITDASTWLTNLAANVYNDYSVTVTHVKGHTLICPEIDQSSSQYPEANDCAVISTLEILNYHWMITDSEKNTAYNAIIDSQYFDSGSGVWFNNNDQIYKIGAESIDRPIQITSDDPEAYFNNENYAYLDSLLTDYGPFYISLDQAPYSKHTVTARGVKRYKVQFTPTYSENYDFAVINDHWSVTRGTTFLSLTYSNDTWYTTAIKLND